jgi:hypothetical protein
MTIRELKTAVVRITGLGSREFGTWGRIASLHGRRLHLSLGEAIEPGTFARIDGPDFLLLGEICFCNQENGEYTAYFDMEHAASDAELKRVQSMLAQPARTE